VDEIVRALKAAADPNRLRILRALASGSYNVAELTEILGAAQSTVSKHLRVLAEAGLVKVRRAGTWAYYSLAGPGQEDLASRLVAFVQGEIGRHENSDAISIESVRARRRRATSAFFREKAPVWDDVRDRLLGPPLHLERIVELVGPIGTVVDLGTGTGVLLEGLGKNVDRVIGIDASAEMLEMAAARAEDAHLTNTELRLGALEHLPLSDGEAEAMVANLVLHHVSDLPAVFREVHRGLAPGGHLIIAALEELAEEGFWKELGAWWPGFRPEELRQWLEAAGFDAIRHEGAPTPPAGNPPGRLASPKPAERPGVFLMEARRA
jgi:ArsR family transcriptional regulator